LEGGLIGGDAGERVGLVVEVTHLGLKDAVEANVGHENSDHSDVGHAPLAGLEGEVVDELVFPPFPPAQQANAGGEQLGNGEEDAENQNEDANEDRIVLAGGDQDPDDIENAFALEEDHLILKGDGFAQ